MYFTDESSPAMNRVGKKGIDFLLFAKLVEKQRRSVTRKNLDVADVLNKTSFVYMMSPDRRPLGIRIRMPP